MDVYAIQASGIQGKIQSATCEVSEDSAGGGHCRVIRSFFRIYIPFYLQEIMTRPLNEHFLWKGAIQRANYPKSVAKPDMILPKICSLTGREINPPDLHSEMNRAYAQYSYQYWLGVELRKQLYRDRNRIF